MIFFMCLVMVVMSAVPMFMGLDKADAANVITLYFDTSSCPSTAVQGWSNSMTKVYYGQLTSKPADNQDYYYTFNESNKMEEDTTVSVVKGTTGKMFKVTIDLDDGAYISFSPWSGSQKGTTSYPIMTYPEFKLSAALNNKVIYFQNTTVGGRFQKVWYTSIPTSTGHAEEKFSALNMTNSQATIKYYFSDRTKNIETQEWNNDQTISSTPVELQMNARTYYYNYITIPDSTVTGKPYKSVIFTDANGNELKKYYFDEDNKILGRTFEYGVTEFSNGNLLCYQHQNPETVPAGNSVVYLDNGFFTSDGAKVKEIATTKINKDGGNASYETNVAVTTGGFTASSLTDGTAYDLSDSLFTVEYDGNKYNLFWSTKATDNLVIVNDDVATMSGVYTVQSTDNVLIEGDERYPYITAQADMFDYQYDHTSNTNSNYSYIYDSDDYVYFTNNKGWNADGICAYFYNDNEDKLVDSGKWPGNKMDYYDTNDQSQKRYRAKIPLGATYVIFNSYSNQTEDIPLETNRGFYLKDSKGTKDGNTIYRYDSYQIDSSKGHSSIKGNAKRPYLTINEALSKSNYSATATNYPMYLGQFWLPLYDKNKSYDTSAEAYNLNTVSQRAAHNDDSETYMFNSVNAGDYSKTFGFGNVLRNFDWSANLAYRYYDQAAGTYEPYNGVVQGLVKNQLKDYNALTGGTLMARDNTNTVPYFDSSWWKGKNFDTVGGEKTNKFTNSQGDQQDMSDYLKTYSRLDFPFFETSWDKIKFLTENYGIRTYTKNNMVTDTEKPYQGIYYVFDSSKNAVKVNDAGTSLEKHYNDSDYQVKDNYGTKGSGESAATGEETGFFPFNSKSDGGANSEKLHYGFGVKFSIDFYYNDNGTLDGTTGGIPITFTFQGDDDVWVFLDDKLALDMGGAHKNSIGEINFKNKTVVIGSAGDVGESVAVLSAKDARTQNFSELGLTGDYIKKGKHKITMYYLERGMLNSNLFVMFNLPMSLTSFELQEDTDFSNVNRGFVNATKYVADQDVFNYAIKNKGTTKVVGSDYGVPTSGTIVRSSNESGVTRATALASTTSETGHTYNFNKDGAKDDKDYVYLQSVDDSGGVHGVSYQLIDMFALNSGTPVPVNYDTREYNGIKNVVSLQYGERASFSKQFNYGSAMSVTQLNEISAPNMVTDSNSSTRVGSLFGNTSRQVSKYYNTYMTKTSGGTRQQYAGIFNADDLVGATFKHVEEEYADKQNYSMNSIVNLQVEGDTAKFNFNDPTDATNEYVHLRQVVVNEIKTAKLTISKDFLTTESDDTTSFDFTIVFNKVFGAITDDLDNASKALIDYSNIRYTKTENDGTVAADVALSSDSNATVGTFSLKAGDYIEIDGIPVGTKFYITEAQNATSQYELAENYSVNLGTSTSPIEVNDDTDAIVYNRRKTGRFDIHKYVYSQDGTTDGSAPVASDTTEFDAVVTFGAPQGVNLAEYDIRVNGTNVTLESGNKLALKIKHDQLTQISGLPYGTTYVVTEGDVPAGYAKLTTLGASSGFIKDPEDGNVEYNMSDKTIHGTNDSTGYSGVVNVYNKVSPIVMPETGGTPLIFLLPYGIIAIALSGAALVIYKKKLQGASLYVKRKGRSD